MRNRDAGAGMGPEPGIGAVGVHLFCRTLNWRGPLWAGLCVHACKILRGIGASIPTLLVSPVPFAGRHPSIEIRP